MFIFAAILLSLSPLEQAVVAIRELPECRPLLDKVEREGGFRVIENQAAPFDAQWNPNRRTIEVNSRNHSSPGRIIVSVLFELHNAANDERIKHLQDLARERRISKKHFVRKIEQREWRNWEATCTILAIGREKRIFPKEALANSFRTFDNYYRVQENSGHTDYHAYHYDLL